MNLLINEPPLQVLPSLAKKVGLNEAIFLQQLHFRLQISNNIQDGHRWVYNSYPDWHREFPFWSEKTIKRVIRKLEDDGYVVSTDIYNRLKIDKTKWYRVDYSKLGYTTVGQNEPTIGTSCPHTSGHNDPIYEDNVSPPLPKEIKSIKNNIVEKLDDTDEIINYLNAKANKNYKATTAQTKRLINGRLSEGYTLDDFKRVIDAKVKDWLQDQTMNKYLRPDTLFNATKFEAYLNEAPIQKKVTKPYNAPAIKLDFNAGEEIGS